jgi:hypothetical protein
MISYPVSISDTVTGGGFLLVLSIVLPVGGSLLGFIVGGRRSEWIVLGTMPFGLGVAIAIAIAMRNSDSPLVYLLGGWLPPLGITLRADGLSVVMIAITAVVICTIGVFARTEFCTLAGSVEARGPFAFWILLSAVWAALNTVFLGGDLFRGGETQIFMGSAAHTRSPAAQRRGGEPAGNLRRLAPPRLCRILSWSASPAPSSHSWQSSRWEQYLDLSEPITPPTR